MKRKPKDKTRAEAREAAVRLIIYHKAPYAAVARHCKLPMGTVAYDVWRHRHGHGIPTRSRRTPA